MIKTLKEHCKQEINTSDLQIAQFLSDFRLKPGNELEWSHTVFNAVARKEKAHEVLTALEKDVPPGVVKKALEKQVLVHSMYPPSSTSPTSNLMSACRGKAVAELLHFIEINKITE